MTGQYHFGPLERRGVFLGARGGQLVVGVVCTAVAVAIFSASPTPLGALAALCAVGTGLAVALLPVAGRTAEQWVPVVARFALSQVTGTGTWVSASHLRGHVLTRTSRAATVADAIPEARLPRVRDLNPDGDAGATDNGWVLGVRRVDAADAQPPYLRGVELLAARWRQGEIGVVKDAARRTYVGVIAARGRSFALLDQDAKRRLLAGWGSVLSAVSREAGAVARVQWLERTVPDDSESVVRFLGEHRSLPASSPFVSSYLALLDEAGPQSQQHEVFIAVQVSAVRASSVIRRQRRGVDVGSCEVLSRELDAFAANLRRADVDVRGILSPRMLAAALREWSDPPAREQLAHRAAAIADMAGASPRNAFPHRSEVSWSALRTEGAHHATYWVSEWPRAVVGTDWLAPLLLGTRARRTVSVVMEPGPPSLALRRVEAARVDDATTRSLRQRLGFRTTVRKQREEETVARAEEELNEGHQQFRLSAYITVTADTRETLDVACADVEQQARQSGLDVRRAYGTQDVAFTYTLPLCRGLR